MKEKASQILLLLLITGLALALVAPAQTAYARSELVRLTLDNRTNGTLFLRLEGPAFYFLRVPGGEAEVFTVQRGVYTEMVTACGVTTKSTLDMSTQQKLVLPVCGGSARETAKAPSIGDLSTLVKVVRVSVINKASTQVLAILTGPQTYVFLLNKDETRQYTIAKGDYKVQIFACRSVTTKDFMSYKDAKLNLKCP